MIEYQCLLYCFILQYVYITLFNTLTRRIVSIFLAFKKSTNCNQHPTKNIFIIIFFYFHCNFALFFLSIPCAYKFLCEIRILVICVNWLLQKTLKRIIENYSCVKRICELSLRDEWRKEPHYSVIITCNCQYSILNRSNFKYKYKEHNNCNK